MTKIISFFTIVLFIMHTAANAQTCTALGQNPSTAFPVCGSTTFNQISVPICGSRRIPISCPDPASYIDKNPFWYKITCYTAGTLGFVITPIAGGDDYDWQLFDITNKNPDDVYTDPSLFVAASWSGNAGPTGASAAGSGLLHCSGGTPLFTAMPNLIAGHVYLLLVSHFTNSQVGYSLSFGGGTAGITDPNVPVIVSATPNCDGTLIGVKFNKPLFCNSLAGNGSDFLINPSGTIASIAGIGCTTGFAFDSAFIGLSAPLAPGNYTLAANLGSDGNTLLDNCGLSIAVGNNVSFTIAPPVPLPMGTVGTVSCAPTSVTLNFTDPIKCNSIAANGSDFTVSGPSAVTVTSATVACNGNGETNSITINFSSPIATGGNYQLQIAIGSDGNTLLGQCSRPVPAASTANFTVPLQSPIPMGAISQPACAPASVTINFTDPLLCNSIAANGSDFMVTGPSTVTVTSAVVSCNGSGETNAITINFSNPISVSGSYQLQIATGSDGNTILGQCLRQVTAGSSATFTVPVASPATMTSIPVTACAPTTIRVNLSVPVQCNSIAANGSDFTITGPSIITVSSAQAVNCNAGLTSSIDIGLSGPIVTGGNYQLQLTTGSDGNTLLSDCYRPSIPASLSFTTSDTVSARFTYTITSDCITDDINFSHPGGNGINSWSWIVNGTAAGNQSTFTQSFPATSQNTVQLTVSNGVCSDTKTEIINLNDQVIVDFTVPDFICPDDSAIFINQSNGPIDTWSWSFGNGQTSLQRDPPAQVYPNVASETFYDITLTASNTSGCSNSKTKRLKVLGTCVIAVPSAFTPNNDGLNDYLYPLNAFNAENIDFKIFNRWGQLVFSSNDWTKKWNGTIKGVPQASGLFAWTLQYTDKRSGKPYSQKGTVFLIR
jgi:gliding motility-associated-like protein